MSEKCRKFPAPYFRDSSEIWKSCRKYKEILGPEKSNPGVNPGNFPSANSLFSLLCGAYIGSHLYVYITVHIINLLLRVVKIREFEYEISFSRSKRKTKLFVFCRISFRFFFWVVEIILFFEFSYYFSYFSSTMEDDPHPEHTEKQPERSWLNPQSSAILDPRPRGLRKSSPCKPRISG